jgi:hypothetical protein
MLGASYIVARLTFLRYLPFVLSVVLLINDSCLALNRRPDRPKLCPNVLVMCCSPLSLRSGRSI